MENKNNPTPADKLKKQGSCENHLNNNPGNTSTGGGQSDQYDKLNYGPKGCSTCQEDFNKNIDSLVGQVENHGSKEHKLQELDVTAAFGKEDLHATKTATNTNIHTGKPFDSHGNTPKPSDAYPDKKGDKETGYNHDGKSGPYDQTNKTGIYGQPDKHTLNKTEVYNPTDKGASANKTGVYGQPDKNTPNKTEVYNPTDKGTPANKTGVYNSTDKNTPYGHNVKNDPSSDWNKEQGGPTYGHGTQTETKHTPGKSEHPADYQKKNGKEIK